MERMKHTLLLCQLMEDLNRMSHDCVVFPLDGHGDKPRHTVDDFVVHEDEDIDEVSSQPGHLNAPATTGNTMAAQPFEDSRPVRGPMSILPTESWFEDGSNGTPPINPHQSLGIRRRLSIVQENNTGIVITISTRVLQSLIARNEGSS